MDVSQKEIFIQNKFNELHRVFDKWAGRTTYGMLASSVLFLVKRRSNFPLSLFSACMALYLLVGEGRRYVDTRPGVIAEMFGAKYDEEFEEGLKDIMTDFEEDITEEPVESLDDGLDFG